MSLSNKTIFAVGGVALLALGIFIGVSFGNRGTIASPEQTASVAGTQADAPVPNQYSDVLENIRISEDSELVKVVRTVPRLSDTNLV